MAITKTANDLIGTATSKTTIAAGSSATSSVRDVSSVIGIVIHCLITYGATAPSSRPVVKVLTSPDNSNFDTEAYAEEAVPTTTNGDKMISLPIGPEIKYFKVTVENGDGQSIEVWVSDVEMTNT